MADQYVMGKGVDGPNFKDYSGSKFGDWEVLSVVAVGNNRPTTWLCRHKCGHERVLRVDQLRRKSKKYCTCEGAPVKARKKQRVAETTGRIASRLRSMNKTKSEEAQKQFAAPPVEPPKVEVEKPDEKKKAKKKLTPAELGRMQAESYAKGYQARGWV